MMTVYDFISPGIFRTALLLSYYFQEYEHINIKQSEILNCFSLVQKNVTLINKAHIFPTRVRYDMDSQPN